MSASQRVPSFKDLEERIAIPQTGVVFRRYSHFLPLKQTSGCMCLSAKELCLFVVCNYSAWFSFSILDIYNETFHLLSNIVNKLKGINTKPQNRKKCWLCRDICRSKTAARTLIRCTRLCFHSERSKPRIDFKCRISLRKKQFFVY